VTTLSSFKVLLTATREPGPEPGENLNATVTAADYRHTSRGWKLIATKRIGPARPGPRIVLVRDGSLQPHGDQAQAGAQLRYAIGHDQSEPAMGPGNRMAAASTKHWRP
jgi:hypothetical protein